MYMRRGTVQVKKSAAYGTGLTQGKENAGFINVRVGPRAGLVENAPFIFTLRNASYGPGSPIHLAGRQFRNRKSVKQL
jgi:hypothetical protein